MSGTVTWVQLGCGVLHMKDVTQKSLTDCQTQAQEFMAANPKYLTRKGLFVYKLIPGEEKKFIKRIQNVDNT